MNVRHFKTFKLKVFLVCAVMAVWGGNALRVYRGTDNLGDVMVRCSTADANGFDGIEVVAMSPWNTGTTMTSAKPGIWEIPRQEKRLVREIRVSNIRPPVGEAALWQISIKDKTSPEWWPLVGEPAAESTLTLRLPSGSTSGSLLPARHTTINWMGDWHLLWLSGLAVVYFGFAFALVAILWQNRRSWRNWQAREVPCAVASSGYMLPFGTAIVTALVFLPFASRGVDFHHDGIMLKPALDVLSGQTLFRDSFTQYGALTTYLHVLALKIYPGLLAIRLETVLAYAVAVFFLVSAWMMFLPKRLVILAYAMFLVFIPFYDSRWLLLPWSSVLALMFQSVALLGLFKCVSGERPAVWGAVVGGSAALVFWCRQPVGIGLSAAVALLLVTLGWFGWQIPVASKARLWTSVAISFSAIHCLFLLELVMSGALGAWFFQNLVWPAMGKTKSSHDATWWNNVVDLIRPHDGVIVALLFSGLCLPLAFRPCRTAIRSPLTFVYYALFGLVLCLHHREVYALFTFTEGWFSGIGNGGMQFFVPLVVMLGGGITAVWAFLRRHSDSREVCLVLTLVVVSGASFLQFYPVPSLGHIAWSLAPCYAVFVYFIWKGLGLREGVAFFMIGIAFSPACLQKLNLARKNLARPLVELRQPPALKGMKVSRELAGYVATLDAATRKILDKAPDTPIAIEGGDALYCAFARSRWNPSTYYVTWEGLATEVEMQARLSKMRQRRPIVLFRDCQNTVIDAFKQSEHYLTIAEIPFQPLAWWWGGQNARDLTSAESPLRSVVVVAPEELVEDHAGQ